MYTHLTLAIYFIYFCLGLIGIGIVSLFALKFNHLHKVKKVSSTCRNIRIISNSFKPI